MSKRKHNGGTTNKLPLPKIYQPMQMQASNFEVPTHFKPDGDIADDGTVDVPFKNLKFGHCIHS